MSEAKTGDAFITHELDEAIAIQRAIVDAETKLGRDHPRADVKKLIKDTLETDRKFLARLEKLGRPKGATGKVEEVAESLEQLMTQTAENAAEAKSEAYEAHAVLLNLKRKQQDSAAAMVRIARAVKDDEMRDAAIEFERESKSSARELAAALAELAVEIATTNVRTSRAQAARA
ncbi:MAG TPA: hypothetical protein VNL94_03310 [Candidatus Binatia bacterium]|nr:hypothetical protein [Candidatus Binatia bacterium]